MLKVKLFNRTRVPGNYSIEGVFHHIVKALEGRVIFEQYFLPGPRKRIFPLIKIRWQSSKINHISGDVHFLGLCLPSKKTIITVHDIGHYEMNLKGMKKRIYGWLWLKWPLSKVKYVTCISEFTKGKLISVIGLKPEKIHVIYNPCPSEFTYCPKEINRNNPIILQIGKSENKNRERLIHAVKGINCKIIFVGQLSIEHEFLLKAQGTHYENPQNVSPWDMHSYFSIADFVYFASTYEGFGLPIIEAQAVGRPVITSNVASMPEVAGKGALYVNPDSVQEIRKAIQLLMNDEKKVMDLISFGRDNIKRFEISAISEQYFQLYSIVSKNE